MSLAFLTSCPFHLSGLIHVTRHARRPLVWPTGVAPGSSGWARTPHRPLSSPMGRPSPVFSPPSLPSWALRFQPSLPLTGRRMAICPSSSKCFRSRRRSVFRVIRIRRPRRGYMRFRPKYIKVRGVLSSVSIREGGIGRQRADADGPSCFGL